MQGARPSEIEALYRERFESFVRVATAIGGDVESGRDAVQSAFVAAMRHRRSFRRDGPLDRWVWRIVVNEARRARRAMPPLVFEPSTEPGEDELSDAIREWVTALPARQREAIFLRYLADLDYRSIARILAIEPGTVSATLNAAHRTLRKHLEEARP